MKQPDRCTIKDVAKSAGVSVSTVSRVINNNLNVSSEKRRKVLAEIKNSGFTPNALARGLVQQENRTVCVVLPDIENSFYPSVLRGIENVAQSNDYSVMLYVMGRKNSNIHQLLQKMYAQQASGLIFVAVNIPSGQIPRAMKSLEIVSIQADIDIDNVCRVDSTNEKGTREIVEHLIKLGHKKIAFIGYKLRSLRCIAERYKGYESALKSHGIDIHSDYIVECDEFDDPGYECVQKLLRLKCPPTAIHCINEKVAVGAYEALLEHNLTVPEDISLTANDNSTIAKVLTPKGLTTIAQPAFEMGVAAAEQLIRNIKSPSPIPCEEIVLGTTLVFRGSTRRI